MIVIMLYRPQNTYRTSKYICRCDRCFGEGLVFGWLWYGANNQPLTKTIDTCGWPAGNQGEYFAGGVVDIAEVGNLLTRAGILFIDKDLALYYIGENPCATHEHDLIVGTELIEIAKYFAIPTYMATQHNIIWLSGIC